MHRLKEKLSGIDAFIKLLEELPIDTLPVSEYNKIYYKKHRESFFYSVQLGVQIIQEGIHYIDKPIQNIRVAEVGGGTGMISLLSKWLGFGNVIYSDTFEQSCEDFKIISEALKLPTNGIVVGGIKELGLKYHGKIDLIVSRDVIEHVYDTADFFTKSEMYFPNAVSVHNTSANIYNLFKKAYFKKIHEKDEWEGNLEQFKPGDSVESYYELRKKYISEKFPDLSESKKEVLAALTRGMQYLDILKVVEAYNLNNNLPKIPSHPTNTCNPNNGNWTERLLTFDEYESYINPIQYKVKWILAPYDEWRNTGIKRYVQMAFNLLFRWIGSMAKSFSPAIVMVIYPIQKEN